MTEHDPDDEGPDFGDDEDGAPEADPGPGGVPRLPADLAADVAALRARRAALAGLIAAVPDDELRADLFVRLGRIEAEHVPDPVERRALLGAPEEG